MRKSIIGLHSGQLLVVWCFVLGTATGLYVLAGQRLTNLRADDSRSGLELLETQAQNLRWQLVRDGALGTQANDSAVRLLSLRLKSPDSKAGNEFDQLPLAPVDSSSAIRMVESTKSDTTVRSIPDVLLGERIRRIQVQQEHIRFWTWFRWAAPVSVLILGLSVSFVWFGGRTSQ